MYQIDALQSLACHSLVRDVVALAQVEPRGQGSQREALAPSPSSVASSLRKGNKLHFQPITSGSQATTHHTQPIANLQSAQDQDISARFRQHRPFDVANLLDIPVRTGQADQPSTRVPRPVRPIAVKKHQQHLRDT